MSEEFKVSAEQREKIEKLKKKRIIRPENRQALYNIEFNYLMNRINWFVTRQYNETGALMQGQMTQDGVIRSMANNINVALDKLAKKAKLEVKEGEE